jgi:hypothetical protein
MLWNFERLDAKFKIERENKERKKKVTGIKLEAC